MFYISYILGLTTLLSISIADVSVLSPEDKCIANIRKEITDRKVSRNLGGIVGIGWDSLTDKATLPVFSQTYHLCRTVPDGDFLVPDNIVVFPIKEANIQKSSEIFESFSHYKSSTAASFEASGGGGIPGLGSASASFSVSTKIGKEHMERNKQTGFSNKIEYHAFTLIGSEKAGFDEVFTMRLSDIAKAIKNKNLLLAQYEAESIIGDYGTHVVNKALAGASIQMLGFSTTTEEQDKKTFSLKMSAQFHSSFLGAVSMGFKAGAEIDNEEDSGSSSTTSQTYIMTKGGPDVNRLLGSNVENKMQIDSVVGLNHQGMPLYSYIHSGILNGTEWDDATIYVVQDLLYNATQEYIRQNLISGCTVNTAGQYFYKANVENFFACTLTPVSSASAFMGGYYQECEYMESYSKIHRNLTNGNQCDEYRHKNPAIRRYCDNDECFNECLDVDAPKYTTYFYVTFHDRIYNAMPDGCNTSDCSKDYTITDRIRVKVHICDLKDKGTGDPSNKMIFGGIYEKNNPFSDSGKCSFGFDTYPIFQNHKICLAPGFYAGTYTMLPNVLSKGVVFTNFQNCLDGEIGRCGESQIYLTTINNCPYYYCVRIPEGSFADTENALINRPPYVSRDMAMSRMRLNFQREIDDLEDTDNLKPEAMITIDGKEVGKIVKTPV